MAAEAMTDLKCPDCGASVLPTRRIVIHGKDTVHAYCQNEDCPWSGDLTVEAK
jgi:hypothetical protein